ncbi:MAG: hypothetical protein DWQ18_05420 [Crenarchaeota archaeon]|nr:MAG: hypothetical protein DWQ17_07715 [Thermoproteota archaeon]RDJ33492.1 MAG: hypothetical protein DWQ18_05420 [Thermoproteota archaeon]RDJ36061.1 MAG: hypothetical protein DWQ13_08580 [Thermoproteota archaeon]RDJ38190.1 MAG: hypothetical protein DWQ19_01755 [Thermoproteota archaeon]
MNSRITILTLMAIMVVSINTAYADENTSVSIKFIGNNYLDLKDDNRLVRADIEIENFDPQDGYYFMKITNLFTGEVIKTSEINPTYREEGLWGMQTSYLVDDTVEDLIGEYEIQIYTEFGTATTSTTFSVVDSSKNPLVVEEAGTLQELTESPETPAQTPSSLLPQWVRNIFILYAEQQISEIELMSALEYLIDQEILQVK